MCELLNVPVFDKTKLKHIKFENADEIKFSIGLMDSLFTNDLKTIAPSLDAAMKGLHNKSDSKLLQCENSYNIDTREEKECKKNKQTEFLKFYPYQENGKKKDESIVYIDFDKSSSESNENEDSDLLEIPTVHKKPNSVEMSLMDHETKKEDALIHKDHDLFDSTIKWLETAHLEKFSRFFGSLTYDDMINLDDTVLEKNEITKGARQRILIAVSKLRERLSLIKEVKSNIDDGGSLVLAIKNLKNILNGPICSKDKENLPERFIEVMNSIGEKLLKNWHLHTELFLFMKLTINVFQSNSFQISHKRTLFSLCNELMKTYQSNIKNEDYDPAVHHMMVRILADKSIRNAEKLKNYQRSNDKITNQLKSSQQNVTNFKGADRKNVLEIARESNKEKKAAETELEEYYKIVKSLQKCYLSKSKTAAKANASDAKYSKNENLIAETTTLNMPKIHVYNKYQKEVRKSEKTNFEEIVRRSSLRLVIKTKLYSLETNQNETPESFSYFSYEWLNEKTKIKPEQSGGKDSLESIESFFERRDNENSRRCPQATNESFAMPHVILEKSCLGFVCEDVRFLPDPQCKPFNNFMTSDD